VRIRWETTVSGIRSFAPRLLDLATGGAGSSSRFGPA
jgi:hypothetical protein